MWGSARPKLGRHAVIVTTPVRSSVEELVSSLSIDRCRELLELGMDPPMTMFGSKPVIGDVKGSKLRARKRIAYRNSFQTYLSARLIGQGQSTVIQYQFSMHPAVIAFMTVWFAAVILGGGGALVSSLLALVSHSSYRQPVAWPGILVPVAMLVFGCGMIAFSRYIARGERQFLITFICSTLAIAP